MIFSTYLKDGAASVLHIFYTPSEPQTPHWECPWSGDSTLGGWEKVLGGAELVGGHWELGGWEKALVGAELVGGHWELDGWEKALGGAELVGWEKALGGAELVGDLEGIGSWVDGLWVGGGSTGICVG